MEFIILCNNLHGPKKNGRCLRFLKSKTILIMKLTAIILTIACLQVTAAGYSQQVTLSEKNASLKDVLLKIREQSKYQILFNDSWLLKAKPVNIKIDKAPIEEVMERSLEGQPFDYLISDKTILITLKEVNLFNRVMNYIKTDEIIGKVLDEKGIPMPGVSVKARRSGKVAITDQGGNYRILVEDNDILIFSYVGYSSTEQPVKDRKMVNVTLEPNPAQLEQVMVTGYQTISRERATGSFTQIGRDVLNSRPVSNLSTALQGMVAGMQAKERADGSVDFLIRGNTSLYADKSPLVVVDGFPVSASDFSDINPNDVESVTVLKDAAAASIWGARAANGVIVIVTKKLKGTSKLKVEANVFTRISNKLNLDQVLTQANSADQVAYERKAFDNNWTFFPYSGSFGDISNSLTLAQELLYANKNGTLSTADMNAGLDRLSKISNRSQIKDLLLQNAILDQYNVNLQSGTEKSKSYASILYEKNKGNYVKNKYDRFNLNFNNSYQLASFLNFNISANLQYKRMESSGATIAEIQDLSPYEMLLNPDGSYATNLNTYNREQLGLIPASKFPYSDWSYNLLREVNGRKLTNQNLSARIQTGLNLKITKGLTFDTKFQYERAKVDYKDYYDESTFFVRSLVNSMTEYNDNTKTVGKSYIPKGGILKGRTVLNDDGSTTDLPNTDLESFLVRNQLNFDKTIGSKHSISAIAGMEISQSTLNTRINPYAYGYSEDKLQAAVPPYGYGSPLDQFTDFEGNSGVTVPGGNTTFGWKRNKFVSFYGNASYTYDNKYTLSGSVRSDASNFITDDPKLRWSPLWSVGAKWNLKNEDFMDNMKSVNRLELRLTYGKNGNVEGSTSTKALLNVGTSLNPNTGTITATIADNGNPFLRWEKTTSTNLGVDFALFNNRLFGTIDVYNKKGEGIIGLVALPAATGTTSQKFNNAGITNRGVEITLGTNVDIPNTPIHYTTSINYAYNYNNINSLFNPSLYVFQMIGGAFVEGRPVNSIYSFEYRGMKDGVPQVAGPNGSLISFNDLAPYNRGLGLPFLKYEGTSTPPHTLGWVNNIKVKDFSLTAVFIGTLGGVYRNPVFDYAATVGFGKTFVNKYISEVLAGNPNLPGFALPNETSTYRWDRYAPNLSSLVESSSYIECKELTLEYTLSKRITKALNINNIRVFAQTRDLGMIWHANSKGYNPDWLPGTDRPQQSYTFGVNLQF
jgi:TonB-linked SusC/RagA family outer membrane protein